MQGSAPHATVGVDIGGSFIKLVYFRPLEPVSLPSYVYKEGREGFRVRSVSARDLKISSEILHGVLRFIRLPVDKVGPFIAFVRDRELVRFFGFDAHRLNVTGGGAFKFEAKILREVGVQIAKLDEMEMLVKGLKFVLQHVEEEVFAYRTGERVFLPPVLEGSPDKYPYLLVNIGSGVSILLVKSDREYARVSGSSIGGATFWGLLRVMTAIDTWDAAKEAGDRGDNRRVDLLVGDIYGNSYERLGLDASVIASSFGKIATREHRPPTDVEPGDMVKSLLFMISNNIGQVAYLNARLHQVRRVYFAGGFIQSNPFVWQSLDYAIKFWSKNQMEALFLVHDGYLGALGALISPALAAEPFSSTS